MQVFFWGGGVSQAIVMHCQNIENHILGVSHNHTPFEVALPQPIRNTPVFEHAGPGMPESRWPMAFPANPV